MNMSNDPKDAVIDLSKLKKGQSSMPKPKPTISTSPISNMITICNEGASMIGHEMNEKMVGHENFTRDDDADEK